MSAVPPSVARECSRREATGRRDGMAAVPECVRAAVLVWWMDKRLGASSVLDVWNPSQATACAGSLVTTDVERIGN